MERTPAAGRKNLFLKAAPPGEGTSHVSVSVLLPPAGAFLPTLVRGGRVGDGFIFLF